VASALFAGQALVPRDLAHARKDFRARIELYPLSEGGRTTGIRAGHISLFLFGTAVVAGRIHPPKDVIVQPGQSAEVTISLVHPIYIESGMPFMIRDGNQGAGWKRGVPAKWSGSCGNGTVVTTISP
jgi:elongation factor Tu